MARHPPPTFNRPPPGIPGPSGGQGEEVFRKQLEDDMDLNIKMEKEKSTAMDALQATQDALQLLDEVEDTGLELAEVLVDHRIRLDDVETSLDKVNNDLKHNQRQIRAIGVHGFVGEMTSGAGVMTVIKNKIFGAPVKPTEGGGNQLDEVRDGRKSKTGTEEPLDPNVFDMEPGDGGGTSDWYVDYEQQMEANVDQLDENVFRLKELASAIAAEIDDQDATIDRIQFKVELARPRMEHQNETMRHLMH